jgi:rhodanese-related sulfurtransferase
MNDRLSNIMTDDAAAQPSHGARAILPSHLNNLYDISTPGQVLTIDLRSPSEFEKSHIYGAVNFRAPSKFISRASFDMIERAFTDDQSRRIFSKWKTSRCMVFYFKGTEFPWDIVDALLEKLKSRGWEGQCFVLKGPFKEFSVSYSRYIVGHKMTQEAKDYVDSQREKASHTDRSVNEQHYVDWLIQVSQDDQVQTPGSIPMRSPSQVKALEDHQRELRREFQATFPELDQAITSSHSTADSSPVWDGKQGQFSPRKLSTKVIDDRFDNRARFVEPLDRGIQKMREYELPGAMMPSPHASAAHKLAEIEGYHSPPGRRPPSGDSFEKISKEDERLAGSDPALSKRPTKSRQSSQTQVDASTSAGAEDIPRKGRGGGILNKMLRRS